MSLRPYAAPTPEVLAAISAHGPIVELGAGDGAWARALREAGITVTAFDVEPQGEGVLQGDETDAAAHDGALLMVWPPSTAIANTWINAKPWPAIIFVGHPIRYVLDMRLYRLALTIELTAYMRKGMNTFQVWVLAAA